VTEEQLAIYSYYFEGKKNIDMDATKFVTTVKILCIVISLYNVGKNLKDRQARPKHVKEMFQSIKNYLHWMELEFLMKIISMNNVCH
jgi:hypothetical protein